MSEWDDMPAMVDRPLPGGFGAAPMNRAGGGGFAAYPGTPYAQQQPSLAFPASPTFAQPPQGAFGGAQQQQQQYQQQGDPWAGLSPNTTFAQLPQGAYMSAAPMGAGLPPGTPYYAATPYQQLQQQLPQGFFGRDPWTQSEPTPAARQLPQNAWWATPASTSSTLPGEESDSRDPYGMAAGRSPGGGMMPLRRVASAGGSSAATSMMGYASGPRMIYKKPEDWRRDFSSPRQGLGRLFSFSRGNSPARPSLARNVKSMFGQTQPHWSIDYSSSSPKCIWDVRMPPEALEVQPDGRPHSYLELQEAATDPPTNHMFLTHPLLPWMIDVSSVPGSVITVSHLLTQIYFELQRSVMESDFWNDGLDEEDRKQIHLAWWQRCAGDREEASRGLRRVDYLLDTFYFLGIVKKGDGEWELKIKRHPKMR